MVLLMLATRRDLAALARCLLDALAGLGGVQTPWNTPRPVLLENGGKLLLESGGHLLRE